ncbi:hypothetical protein J6590_086308 [Homalodisca vitripennis]|nr:hypothetical protein J6590_086308 [Homalodisca vitripennis]
MDVIRLQSCFMRECAGLAISTRTSLFSDTRVYRALQDWPQCYELFVCGRIVRE